MSNAFENPHRQYRHELIYKKEEAEKRRRRDEKKRERKKIWKGSKLLKENAEILKN